jgi:hypothetical protein
MRHGRRARLLSIYVVTLILLAAASPAGQDKSAGGRTQTSESQTFRFLVRRQFDAEVSKVDATTGLVVIKTPQRKLELEAAPGAAGSLRMGDPVFLELGLLPSRPAVPAAQRRSEPDQAVVRQQVEAQVVEIDLRAGLLTLKAPAGTVTVDLPSHVITRFKKGDFVPVELAVISRPAAAASGPDEIERGRRAGLAGFLLGIFGKR